MNPPLLFILDYNFKRWSTVDRFFVKLAQHYTQAGRRIIYAVPVAPIPELEAKLVEAGAELVILPRWRSNPNDAHSKKNARRALVDLVRQIDITTVELIAFHFCDPMFTVWLGLYLAWQRRNIPIFFQQHNEVKISGQGLRSLFTRHLSKLRLASWFCVRVGSVYEEGSRRLILKGIAPNKAHFIHNGIDLADAHPKRRQEDVYHEFGIPEKQQLIIYVGRLIAGKGLRELFNILPEIFSTRPQASLLLVGEGPLRDELQQRAHDHGIANHVIWAGRRSDVTDLMGASHLLVLPSYTEALPSVILEAGAAGIPVVATTVGGIPEIVGNGCGEFLVPPRNTEQLKLKILELLSNDRLANEQGKLLHQRVKELFSFDCMVDGYIRLYGAIASHPKRL